MSSRKVATQRSPTASGNLPPLPSMVCATLSRAPKRPAPTSAACRRNPARHPDRHLERRRRRALTYSSCWVWWRARSPRWAPPTTVRSASIAKSFSGTFGGFGALLGQLQAKAGEFDVTVARFAERLRVGRIGLYTTEQEADELALEWVNLLGFPTRDAVEGWITYLQFFEKWGPPYGEPSAKECGEKFRADFKDGNKFTTVFLGDLDSAHHAGCYRVYNLS